MDKIDGWIKDYLGEKREVPADLEQQAKDLMPARRLPLPGRQAGAGRQGFSAPCPHCGKAITPFKKPPVGLKLNWLWLVAAALAFGGSFAVPRYFMQFLAVALFCGVKWVVERRAAKTQILIYKALAQDEGSRLHKHASRL